MTHSRNWFPTLPPSRQRRLLASQRQGKMIVLDGQSYINFSSNDYLGLSAHPQLSAAAVASIQAHGFGSGASRLVSGDDAVFHAFEHQLAAWKGFESCLLMGSGMLANIGLLQAVVGRGGFVFADKLNHASLVDGARLSMAKVLRFAHLDTLALEKMLQTNQQNYPDAKRVIVSDGVFSMDGDAADVAQLLRLADTYDALLIIDDAHGTGTMGNTGKGLIDVAGVAGHTRLLEVGTLGKSFGSYGAYILGCAEMVEGLRQRMRTFIYSTALPVAAIAAAQAALAEIQQGQWVAKLQDNVAFFLKGAQGLTLMPSLSPIQPVLLGSDEAALDMAQHLRAAGIFAPAIRPPTVPEGTSRVRLTLSAAHTRHDIQQLLDALAHYR